MISGRPLEEVLEYDAMDIQSAYTAYGSLNRESWEQTRILAYSISRPYLKNNTTIKEYWELYWDNENNSIENKEAATQELFDELINKHGGGKK